MAYIDPQAAADQAQLDQRVAMAKALRERAMQQDAPEETQIVSGRAVYQNPLAGLAKALAKGYQGYRAKELETQNTEQVKQMAKKSAETRNEDVQRLVAALRGTPENAPADGMGPVMPAQPANPQEALQIALQSRDPMMQATGQKLLESQLKPPSWKMGERFNEQTGQPEKIMYNENDPSQIKPIGGQQAIRNESVNLGGKTVFVNPYTQTGALTHTQSPDSMASNATAIRGQNMADVRAQQTLAQNQGKLPEAQQKQVVGVTNLQKAIDEYQGQLKNWGAADILSPNQRALMGVKYNNMMLQAKEAYNLGVLNGPDFEILTSVVTDPRSVSGAFTSNDTLQKQSSELKRIMSDVGKTAATPVRAGGYIVPQADNINSLLDKYK